MSPPDPAERIRQIMAGLSPSGQAALRAKLIPLIRHRQAIQRFPTPGHLSQFHRPEFVQTPMLDILDNAIMMADRGEASRIIVNTPPQEGKTSRLQDGCAWMLLRNPRRRIVFASYEQSIAAQSSLEMRRLIETHGGGYRGQQLGIDHRDVLGLRLDPDRAQQTAWSLADVPGYKSARAGSVVAVGVGSSLSGRPADIIVIDDPIKDAKQADSATWRKAVTDWYQSVVIARLPPKSVIIVVQTRWHEEDLTGWLLKQDAKLPKPKWMHINVPAQADEPDDLLGRDVGQYMISTRGRNEADWEEKKREAGTRWWFAMYQGRPAAPEGGTFKREWFDKHRVAEAPPLKYVLTVIDPADNSGGGDEAGIITGGIGEDGDWYLLEDNSGTYTIGEWVRQALFAMLRNKAGKLAYEISLSRLRKSIRIEWKRIRAQARALVEARETWRSSKQEDWPETPIMLAIQDATKALMDELDTLDEVADLGRQLLQLWPWVPAILRLPEMGPPVQTIRAVGSKSVRAELASPFWESGKIHHVGDFPTLENQCATWLPTQDSPDRMDAAVHWANKMSELGVASMSRAPSTQKVPTRTPPMPINLRTPRRGR